MASRPEKSSINDDDDDDDEASIVVPERLSVRDLREWLSRFGQANKQHFEANSVSTINRKQTEIQSRIRSLESALGEPKSLSEQGSPTGSTGHRPLSGESPPFPLQDEDPPALVTASTCSQGCGGGDQPEEDRGRRCYDNSPPMRSVTLAFTGASDPTEGHFFPSPDSTVRVVEGETSSTVFTARYGDEETRETAASPMAASQTAERTRHHDPTGSPSVKGNASVRRPMNGTPPAKSKSESGFRPSPPYVDSVVSQESPVRTQSSPAKPVSSLLDASRHNSPSSSSSSVQKKKASPSKGYRIEPVKPRMRVLGTVDQRLLELPTPQARHQPSNWDDELADGFSEITFPPASATKRPVGTGRIRNHAALPKKVLMKQDPEWNETASDWVGPSQDEDQDNDDDDDHSLLDDSASVDTGRYTDPGRVRRSRKNRFPLWLCHKRKPRHDDDDDVGGENDEEALETTTATTPTTLYESPPRPLPTDMHGGGSAFFPDGVLTKTTLDLLCRDDSSPSASSMAPPFRGDRINDEERTPASPDHTATSSRPSSTTSSEAPAIMPGAVHGQLEVVLAREECKHPTNKTNAGSSSSVSSAIHKWDGRPRRTRTKSCGRTTTSVADRRRKLQQALEKDRSVVHVKRIEWFVCPDTGLYKKKIMVVPKK